MELFEYPGLMVPSRGVGGLFCAIFMASMNPLMEEKQPVDCSFALSLSGDNVNAGFLKSCSEMVVLFALVTGYETQ